MGKENNPAQSDQASFYFLKSIVDGLPFAVFCKDYQSGTGEFVAWNRGAEMLWGLKFEQVFQKTDYDLFPKQQADFFKYKDLETLQGDRIVFVAEEPADSIELGKTWVRTWKIPLRDENGVPRYLLGVCQDVAEIKSLEEELKLQTERALMSRQLEEQANLARNITHELHNPLAIIIGKCSQLLKLSEIMQSSQASEMVGLVQGTAKLSAQKIDALLTVFADGKPHNPDAGPSADAKFAHDFINLIAIAYGKSKQALKILDKEESPDQIPQLREKLDGIVETLKRMQFALEAQQKNLGAVAPKGKSA